ncbi:hypothetical protein SAMN05421770_10611 [Granulicella rosea]|uniref:Uncharacterized protein n=1 Tax=Granulicella rosea TaxID=474952 RepID=A0A239L286_9BACT|nr:hypothetical protein [Granulicella rosea]SNT23849.1 hypothetical protein SAMN05421770_10611 [Granulicella rosea]
MTRTRKTLIFSAICAGVLLLLPAIGISVFEGFRDTRRIDAADCERAIRNELPADSPIATVDAVLTKHGIEHSFDSASGVAYARVTDVKGSNFLVRKTLLFTFHFTDNFRLQSIEVRTALTGL